MSKAPNFSSVAGASSPGVVDVAAARVAMLVDADTKMHALAAGWGGPGCWCSLRLSTGNGAEMVISVPPSVTEIGFRFLVSGSGRVTVTSTNDAVGTQLDWNTDGPDGIVDAVTVATAGPIAAAAGASSGRAVTVRAALGWSWADETIVIASAAGYTGTVYGVLIQPVYVSK